MNRPSFVLLTNFYSPTTRALQRAAARLGGRVVVLDEVRDADELRRCAPVGALVYMYGYPESAARQVDLLRRQGLPVAVWQVDDPHYFRRSDLHEVTVRIARTCDVYFSHTRELDSAYRERGVEVEYLPTAARDVPGAEALVGGPPAEEDYELDYVFVGTPSAARRTAFERLERLVPALRGRFVTEVSPLEAMRLSRFARVTVFFGAHTSPAGDPDSWGLSERSWEVPWVGGLLVQEDRPHLRDHFVPGVDAVSFRTVDECADLVRTLCASPDERRALATRAHLKVVAEHRLEHRLERVLERMIQVHQARAAGASA